MPLFVDSNFGIKRTRSARVNAERRVLGITNYKIEAYTFRRRITLPAAAQRPPTPKPQNTHKNRKFVLYS